MSENIIAPVTGTCIAASAGTGKTYSLTSRFLALLALGASPESLIALTFTNKAAGEFRSRILSALAEGARHEDADSPNPATVRVVETILGMRKREDGSLEAAGSPLAPHVAAKCRAADFIAARDSLENILGRKLDADFFKAKLAESVRKLRLIQLSTMDSFFQKIVCAHNSELGVNAVTPIMNVDIERARREGILAMLAYHARKPVDHGAFLSMYHTLTGDKSGSMVQILDEKIAAFNHLVRKFPNENNWGDCKAMGFSTSPAEKPLDREKLLAELGEWSDKSSKIGSAVRAMNKLLFQEVFSSLENHLDPNNARRGSAINKILEQEDSRLNENERQFRSVLEDAVEKAKSDTMRKLAEKTHAIYQLLHQYNERYNEVVQSTGRLTFDEMTQKAKGLMQDWGSGAAADMDAQYDHWMLDEFQDTNLSQWQTLACLLDEICMDSSETKVAGLTARYRSLFVVGDVKQSIYGFRHAEPELFAALHNDSDFLGEKGETYRSALVPAAISCSFRSAPEIMGKNGFINMLFGHIASSESEKLGKTLQQYSKHDVADRNKSMKGYVQVASLPPGNADETKQSMYPAVCHLLREKLTEEVGGKLRLKRGLTAAVLTRTNDEALQLVRHIKRELNTLPVQLISEDFVAVASPLGELFMSFFLWLRHPADKYRRTLAGLSRFGIVPEKRGDWLTQIEREGYAAVLQDLAACMGDEADPRTVREWISAAMAFDNKGGSLDDWIWAMKRLSIKGAGSPGYLQVMTMHKSKGLEFDAVILPYVGSDELDNTRNLPRIMQKGDGLIFMPGKETRSVDDVFQTLVEDWKESARHGEYNLMYVAMTRAKYANYILVHGDTDLAGKQNETGIIMRALGITKYAPSKPGAPYTEQWAVGDPEWYDDEDFIKYRAKKEKEADHLEKGSMKLGTPVRCRQKLSPSQMGEQRAGRDGSGYAFHMNALSGDAEFGTAVHACFEKLAWWDGSREGLPRELASPSSEAEKHVAAALPKLAALFSRPSPRHEVFNEQCLDFLDEASGAWVTGTIDRLVVETADDGKTALHATVVDYKTDNASAAQLIARHHTQMDEYRKGVASALRIPETEVEVLIVSVPSNSRGTAAVVRYEAGA